MPAVLEFAEDQKDWKTLWPKSDRPWQGSDEEADSHAGGVASGSGSDSGDDESAAAAATPAPAAARRRAAPLRGLSPADAAGVTLRYASLRAAFRAVALRAFVDELESRG